MRRVFLTAVFSLLAGLALAQTARQQLLFNGGSLVTIAGVPNYAPVGSQYSASNDVTDGSYAHNQSIVFRKLAFPNNVAMTWGWSGGCGGSGVGNVCSYPHISYGYGSNVAHAYEQISALTNYSVSFSYYQVGNALDALFDEWLSASSSGAGRSFEIEVQPYVLSYNRAVYLPAVAHITSPFSADVFGPSTSAAPQIFVYPTTTFTNQFVNSTLAGSVAGTPGTDPTGTDFTNPATAGVTKTIVGSGSTTASDGSTIDYVDIRFSGTPSSSGGYIISFSPHYYQGNNTTTYPQAWWFQPYIALVAGSLANTSNYIQISGYCGQFSECDNHPGVDLTSLLTATPQRFAISYNPINTVTYTTGKIRGVLTNGKAVNFTLRIGISQNGGQPGLIGLDPQLTVTNTTWDFKALMNSLVSAGLFTGAQYVVGHQFGPEVLIGNGSFNLNSFSATWN